jgi:hypothetical protein
MLCQSELGFDMRIPTRLLSAFLAVVTISAAPLQTARADSGKMALAIYKAGWVIGASGGSGKLVFHGHTYRLEVGGIDYGLVFGGPKTELSGRVSNIRRASDVEGVYGAVGAGLAVVRGVRSIVLRNQKGAVLELSGRQVGLMVNVDLSGLALSLK